MNKLIYSDYLQVTLETEQGEQVFAFRNAKPIPNRQFQRVSELPEAELTERYGIRPGDHWYNPWFRLEGNFCYEWFKEEHFSVVTQLKDELHKKLRRFHVESFQIDTFHETCTCFNSRSKQVAARIVLFTAVVFLFAHLMYSEYAKLIRHCEAP